MFPEFRFKSSFPALNNVISHSNSIDCRHRSPLATITHDPRPGPAVQTARDQTTFAKFSYGRTADEQNRKSRRQHLRSPRAGSGTGTRKYHSINYTEGTAPFGCGGKGSSVFAHVGAAVGSIRRLSPDGHRSWGHSTVSNRAGFSGLSQARLARQTCSGSHNWKSSVCHFDAAAHKLAARDEY